MYECVQTIMTLDTEKGLKVLAINILGRYVTVFFSFYPFVDCSKKILRSKKLLRSPNVLRSNTYNTVLCLHDSKNTVLLLGFVFCSPSNHCSVPLTLVNSITYTCNTGMG